MRAPGIVQTFALRSISAGVARRTSLVRVPVKINNSNASRIASVVSAVRNSAMNAGTA